MPRRPLAAAFVAIAMLISPAAEAEAPQEVRAGADALIAQYGVAGLFENASEALIMRLRHRPSGAVCTFYGGVNNLIEAPADGDRTEYFHCRTMMAGGPLTLAVVRTPLQVSLTRSLDEFALGVGDNYRGMQPMGSYVMVPARAGLPASVSRAYRLVRNPHNLVIQVSFAQHGRWAVAQTLLGREAEAEKVARLAQQAFDRARRGV